MTSENPPSGGGGDGRELRRLRQENEQLKREMAERDLVILRLNIEANAFKEALRLLSHSAINDRLGQIQAELERIGSQMATLDSLAQQVTDLRGNAAQEAQEVKTKLDEMTALIQQLQQSQNDPAKVDAISQDLENLRGEIQGIFTGEAPPPTSRRR
jgi:chromosome segregation ATPase